jgi:hypothetical protein
MLTRILMGTALVMCATAASADGGDQQEVTLEGLQSKCAEFVANDQLRPVKVTITCDQLSYMWRAGKPTASELANTRSIGAKVRVKGMEVAHEFYPAEAEITPTTASRPTRASSPSARRKKSSTSARPRTEIGAQDDRQPPRQRRGDGRPHLRRSRLAARHVR